MAGTPQHPRRPAFNFVLIGAAKPPDPPNMHIVITTDDLLRGLSRGALSGAYAVRFLGSSYANLVRVQSALGNGAEVRTSGHDINVAAHTIIEEMRTLDAQLWPGANGRDLWDASDIAERGPETTLLYRQAAGAIAFLNAASSQRPTIFVTDERDQARTLYRLAQDASIAIQLYPQPAFFALENAGFALRCTMRGIRKRAGFIWRLTRQRWVMRKWRQGASPLKKLKNADVIIVNWADAFTYDAEHPIDNDRFFGTLPKVLRNGSISYAFLSNTLEFNAPFADIARNSVTAHDDVVLMCELQTVRAAVAGALRSLAFPWLSAKTLHMGGHDLTALLKTELWRELSSWRQTQALSFASVGKSLAHHSIAPKAVLYPYENQPWEKLLCRSLRDNLPQTRLVAAIISFFSDTFLSHFPSDQDIAQGRVPDVLLVNGSAIRDHLVHGGFPAEHISIGGAIRYQMELKPTRKRMAKDDTITVLCCGDITYDATLQLITKAIVATSSMNYVRLVVNLHPVMDEDLREEIQRQAVSLSGCDGDHVIFSTKSTRELLEHADVVLYGLTGSVFEALAGGVPVVFVGSLTDIHHDKLPTDLPVPRVHDAHDLAALLSQWHDGECDLSLPEDQRQAFLNKAIAPLHEQVWRSALGFNGTRHAG